MEYRRANTDWMHGSFGISLHWTVETMPFAGKTVPFEEAVNAFDPDRLVKFMKQLKCSHMIFTLTHARQQIPAPCPVLDSYMPGRTTRRDLIGELMEAAAKENIRFVAYYNHSCNNEDDPEWKEASGYNNGNLDDFAARILNIVEYIARRYGKKLNAWWFDSAYTVDIRGPHNGASRDLGSWHFPWETLAAAAKTGNPDAAVTFNAGTATPRYLYSTHQDYYSGETEILDSNYAGHDLIMQDHRWTSMEKQWVYKNAGTPFEHPRYTESEYREFVNGHTAHGTMVTLNLSVDQSGMLNPESKEILLRIRRG